MGHGTLGKVRPRKIGVNKVSHRLALHVIREVVHDEQQRRLSDNDHVTKLAGGTPTHEANHKTVEGPGWNMPNVVRAASGRCE
jgi:hypothetical protein